MDSIERAYNLLYRNFPGWFYEPVNLSKSYEVEESKKPIIGPVTEQGNASKERSSQDSYDMAGSQIRNQVRESGLYDRHGRKTSI